MKAKVTRGYGLLEGFLSKQRSKTADNHIPRPSRNDFPARNKTDLFVYVTIGVLPFLLFYWTLPFLYNKTVGSDYLRFAMSYQMELLFSIKSGSVPLFVPGFAGGQSSSVLTLGQFFHPLPHIASIMPGYWDGKAIEWNTLLKLISLAFTHMILFLFLKKIRLDNIFSFLLSFFTVYNLRVLDLFRNGPHLEAYTAGLILCSVIGWSYITRTKWLGPLSIVSLTYLLVCSGQPEETYYGMLGTVFFVLIAPFFLSSILSEKHISFKIAFQFWIRVGSYMLLGILLSSVYVLPYYFDFIAENTERVTQTYAMANSVPNSLIETLNNFFFALRSKPMSAFGGASLILIPATLPVLRVSGIKIPRSVWIIWGISLLVFLHMLGDRTPVHRLAWQYLPFASSIRNAGRISMMMPLFLMLIFAWIIKAEPSTRSVNSASTPSPLIILAITASLLLLVHYLIYIAGYLLYGFESELTLFSNHFPGNKIYRFFVELIITILGIGALLLLTFMGLKGDSANRLLGVLLITVTIIQVSIVIKYRSGDWIEKKVDAPTFSDMQAQKRESLNYRYYQGYGVGSSSVKKQLGESFLEPFLGRILTEVISVKNQDEAYRVMQQNRMPQQAFIEGYNIADAKMIIEGAKNMNKGTVMLIYSSFNRLQFKIYSGTPAIFGLSYPYTKNWSAWLNGGKVNVYRVNGSALAVKIPEGESIVEFRYWSSAAFWGVVISCTTFALIWLFVGFRTLEGMPRIISIVIILLITAGGFILWYKSLYSGENLKTRYSWSYIPPLKRPNLAYGKRNWLDSSSTSSAVGARELELYKSRFVDGDRRPNSGFTTRLSNNPTWFIDLYKPEYLSTVLLYENDQPPRVALGPLNMHERIGWNPEKPYPNNVANVRPLIVSLSIDGNTWRIAASVVSLPIVNAPLRITFDKPEKARYVRISASGKSMLAFNEVEIYGPIRSEKRAHVDKNI